LKKNKTMKILGSIGIGDIPQLTNADKVKTNLPLMQELCEKVKATDYMNESNVGNMIATRLANAGGGVYYSQDALAEYGKAQVDTAFKYYKEFQKSYTPTSEEKMAVCGWIASNIFDVDKMKEESI